MTTNNIRSNVRLTDIPYDADYREGMEQDPSPQLNLNRAVLTLAFLLGVGILGLAFWPTIAEFFTPFRIGMAIGMVMGGVGALVPLIVMTYRDARNLNRVPRGEWEEQS